MKLLSKDEVSKLSKQDYIKYLLLYIDNRYEEALKDLLSNDSFSRPAYSENQAHLLGQIKICKKLKELLQNHE